MSADDTSVRSPGAARRPHLLWVNHFAVAPDMGGGTRHIEMSRELVRLGWRVTIAASDFHLHRRDYLRRAGASDRAPVREEIDGVTMAWLWAAPYRGNDHRRVWNWLSFGRSLGKLRLDDRPDVVIGSTPHLFAARTAGRLARRLGVPFVLEVRDLWPESLAVTGRRPGLGYHALAALARSLYRSADAIVVLADGVRNYLAKTGVPRGKIAFVPNGVDAARYADVRGREERDTLRLVYAGAHGPANGLEAVLDAAERLRDEPRVSWLLVGDGPSRDELKESAARRGLTCVTFAEPVPKSRMPSLLAECDAGLMVLKDVPLFSYGVSPNKLFDYWGASLPVVCNVPGEVAKLVEQANGGVQAADGSGAALAAAVRRLLALSPARRRALGRSGREWVERERDRPLLAARLDTVLRRAMAERS
ncbi:MAG TPA: glycosyltransferase family 4 protein [Gemmatimonadaceae bacterium]|nr:glycosyltransferase family 4 protein [Gemmatimonadaceae bacterium]